MIEKKLAAIKKILFTLAKNIKKLRFNKVCASLFRRNHKIKFKNIK